MYHGQELLSSVKTHHGHTPRSHYHRACSNMVGNEKQYYHGQPLAGADCLEKNPWLNVPSEVKDTFKLIQKSHYFFWIFFNECREWSLFLLILAGTLFETRKKDNWGSKKDLNCYSSLPQGNSLVSHCASPRTHNFATSKEAAIFTGRIKRGNCGRFVVLMLLTAILIILSGWKDVFLEIRPSPIAQNDHLKPKLSIWCRFAMKRERWPPLPSHHHLFICVFYSLWLHKKYMLRRKKIGE